MIIHILGQYLDHEKVWSLSTFRSHGCSPYRQLEPRQLEPRQLEPLRSRYRVTESKERVRSVANRCWRYHRVVSGKPHNAQTSTRRPLWRLERVSALEPCLAPTTRTTPAGAGDSDTESRSQRSVPDRWQIDGDTTGWCQESLNMATLL